LKKRFNIPPAMRRIVCLLAWAFAAARMACGQDSTGSEIRVTTALHDDGSKTVTQVDSENHTSEASTYNAANRLLRKVVYTLDDQNDPVQGLVYDAKGHELYKAIYKRNEMGRVSEELEYTPDDRLLGRFVYRYDGNGRLLKIDAYDAEGNPISQTGAIPDKKSRRNE